jgi:hypothetical protein
MVFGETARLSWSGDPRGLWKAWDDFGIQGTEFLPFFLTNCPVRTDHTNVLATAYRKPGRTFVALGSWAKEPTDVKLRIDWAALGLDPARAALYAPAIAGMQTQNRWQPGEAIPVAPKRGWFLVLDEVPRHVPRAADAAVALVEVFRDMFTAPTFEASWKVAQSSQPGTAVAATASALRLTAPAHVHAGLERALPRNVRAVEVELEPGTDVGQTWGPGIALVWPDGKAAKLNARLEDMKFGLFADGAFEIAGGPLARDRRLRLRLLLGDEEVFFQQQDTAGAWREIGRLPRANLKGDPATLRVGKHAEPGTWRDHGSPGPAGDCAIREVRVLAQ